MPPQEPFVRNEAARPRLARRSFLTVIPPCGRWTVSSRLRCLC